ncbi:MAG: SirB2 family protein [Zoogloea sp.]|uniref:SirB2 family protein n=1 Tax=Zoogloea sp. TaxID=49181 RepID=UPI003F3DC7D4
MSTAIPSALVFYPTLKHLHVACVALSGCGFALRYGWMLTDSPLARARATRVLPHLVDSLLLLSALGLVVLTGQYPLVQAWLTAKLVGLLVYIGLGMQSLRPGRPKAVRAACGAAALLVLGWMVSVALLKHPLGYWGLLLAGQGPGPG